MGEAEEALEGFMTFDKAADDLPILRSTSVVALHLHGTAHRRDQGRAIEWGGTAGERVGGGISVCIGCHWRRCWSVREGIATGGGKQSRVRCIRRVRHGGQRCGERPDMEAKGVYRPVRGT